MLDIHVDVFSRLYLSGARALSEGDAELVEDLDIGQVTAGAGEAVVSIQADCDPYHGSPPFAISVMVLTSFDNANDPVDNPDDQGYES